MALEELENYYQEYEEEEEGEVDLDGELISALDEIERLKLKNRKQKYLIKICKGRIKLRRHYQVES